MKDEGLSSISKEISVDNEALLVELSGEHQSSGKSDQSWPASERSRGEPACLYE